LVGRDGARCLNIELRPEWVRTHRARPYGYSFAGAGIAAVGQLELAFRRGEVGHGGAEDLVAAAALHRLLDTASGCDATKTTTTNRRPCQSRRPPAWMRTVTEL